MPGIDGIELLKRLKADGRPFPVLIMTGHGDIPLEVEAMKVGAVDFLGTVAREMTAPSA